MNFKKIALAAALVATSTASYAWVSPFGNGTGFGDGVGDGSFNFSMNSSVRGNGYGNGYGHPAYGHAPYGYGYAPYGHAPYAAPALTEDQKAAFEAQQKAAAEFHKKAQEQMKAAYEAQQKAAAEFHKNAQGQAAYGPQDFFKQIEAQQQAEIKAHQDQMEAMRKQMDEQRKASIEAHKKARDEFLAMRKAPFEAK